MSKDKEILPEYLRDSLQKEGFHSENDIRMMEDIWNFSSEFSYPETKVDASWSRLESKIKGEMPKKTKVFTLSFYKWAAAAMITLAIGTGIYFYQASSQEEFYSASFQTENSRQTYSLPDGTTITLDLNTELKVNKISEDTRDLSLLKGKIYLDVTHNQQAFVLHTPQGDIHVKGTKFYVDANKDQYSVYLEQGKIVWENGKSEFTLEPNQRLVIENNEPHVQALSDTRSSAWITGVLSFEKTLLSEVIEAMEEHYSVHFEYDESLNAEPVTVTFNQLSPYQAATILSKVLGAEVKVVE